MRGAFQQLVASRANTGARVPYELRALPRAAPRNAFAVVDERRTVVRVAPSVRSERQRGENKRHTVLRVL